jgi:hypothetical protein
VMAVLARLLEGRYEPASSVNAAVPPDIDTILAKALAVERSHRYQSAREMRLALAEVRKKLEEGVAFTSVGPPSIQSDFDLPRERTLPTPAAAVPTHVPAPTLTSVAEFTQEAETAVTEGGGPLQLDVPDNWRAGHTVPPKSRPKPRRAVNWGWWVLMLALVGVGIGAWLNWDALTGRAGELASESTSEGGGEPVLILIETTPKDAIVFVDDVQSDARPLQIPRSEDPVKLRIIAEGYEPRVMQLVPSSTRRLEVKLDRAEKKRRK